MMRGSILGMAALAVLMAAPAAGQLLPGRLGSALPAPIGGLLGQAPGAPLNVGAVSPLDIAVFRGPLSPRELVSLRRERLRELVRANRRVLDLDEAGAPVRLGEVIAIAATPDALDRARAAGFEVARSAAVDGVAVTVLRTPRKLAARKAIAVLRGIDPAGNYELNHVYQPAGRITASGGTVASGGRGGSVAIGLVDGGIAAHPAFATARIEQRGFAGAVQPSGHGTAVASLLVGEAGTFRGAATGATVYAADVYGGSPAAGSAEAISQALGWLATRNVRVVNISLVGPPNRLLELSLRALMRRGVTVVAAVGNDGPAAPPQYPAAYEGVVAVTAVDPRGRVLAEAGHAAHLDFAAPGSEMAGAVPGGGYEALRGTSFAAPLVAARLVRLIAGGTANPVEVLAAEATPGKNVGRGIVCAPCRIAPRSVGAR